MGTRRTGKGKQPMSARYEISEGELDVLAITGPEGTRYIDGEEIEARVIRQQSAEIAALKDALADEVTANEAFRKAGSARDDEDMPTFCARLIAERDKYRGQLFDCELALKMEHDLLCEKRAELAAVVAERDRLARSGADLSKLLESSQSELSVVRRHGEMERESLIGSRDAWKLRAEQAAVSPKMTNAHHHGCAFDGWQCFHCGEVFTTIGGAQDHFGAKPDSTPGCMLKVALGNERGWLMELRKAEARLAAVDAAPTVATVIAHTDQGEMWPALDYEDENLPPIGTELIAKPAKD